MGRVISVLTTAGGGHTPEAGGGGGGGDGGGGASEIQSHITAPIITLTRAPQWRGVNIPLRFVSNSAETAVRGDDNFGAPFLTSFPHML